jgi:hypothetical protein
VPTAKKKKKAKVKSVRSKVIHHIRGLTSLKTATISSSPDEPTAAPVALSEKILRTQLPKEHRDLLSYEPPSFESYSTKILEVRGYS